MPRATNINKAFAPSQRKLIRAAPFHITVWEGKVMGGYPEGVAKQVLTSCLQKGVLYGTPDGIRILYQLTDFGRKVLTLLEAQGKVDDRNPMEKPNEPDNHLSSTDLHSHQDE